MAANRPVGPDMGTGSVDRASASRVDGRLSCASVGRLPTKQDGTAARTRPKREQCPVTDADASNLGGLSGDDGKFFDNGAHGVAGVEPETPDGVLRPLFADGKERS